MALPEGFDEWEHLQDMVRRDHNKAVKAYFKNQPDDDISKPKAALKQACVIKDGDTATMTMMRLWLFEITVGHAQSLQAPIYGIPVQELQRNVKYKPQVKLFFREKLDKNTDNSRNTLATGEITFRLMDESSESINRTKVEKLATNIKREFGTPIFTWEKGWYKATYLDSVHGYDLRLLVKSKAEAIRIIKQVLQIQTHVFNNDYFQYVEHDRSYSLNPGTHKVYGSTVKKIIQRPRVDVRFKYAQLLIHGRINSINLVATSDSALRSVIERI